MRSTRLLLSLVCLLLASAQTASAATVYITTVDSGGATGGELAALNSAVGSAIQVANSYGFAGVRLAETFDPLDPTALCTNDKPLRRQQQNATAMRVLQEHNVTPIPAETPTPETLGAQLLQPDDLLVVVSLTRAQQAFNKFTGVFTNDVLLNMTEITCRRAATKKSDAALPPDASGAAATSSQLWKEATDAATTATQLRAAAEAASKKAADAKDAAAAKDATQPQKDAAKRAADDAAAAQAKADEAALKAQEAAKAASGGVFSRGWGHASKGALIERYNQNPISGLGTVTSMLTSPWINKYRLWLNLPITFLDSFKHEQRSLDGTIYCATTEAMLDMLFERGMIKTAVHDNDLRAYHLVGAQWRRVPGVNYCKERQPVHPRLGDPLVEP